MTRAAAIESALSYFDDGGYLAELGPRIAIPTESQNPERLGVLRTYLEQEMIPAFEAMGHDCQVFENPVAGGGPVLLACRIEDASCPTVLGYGHGDVIRGQEGRWKNDRDPWTIEQDGDRVYGRGTADNKGQHILNMAAMRHVLETRGSLGFNSKFMIEMGEENGSAGLHQIVSENAEAFAADVFIASDGPRISPDTPTIFLGARGAKNFDLVVDLREGGHHSGNWGGLLANPGIILAQALTTIVGPTGELLVKDLLPPPISNSVREALSGITIDAGESGPEIDPDWGAPGLTPAERVYAWNIFEILTLTTGNPGNPVNAVPPKARAHCQFRFVAGTNSEEALDILRRHLDEHGFERVKIEPPPPGNAINFKATRTPLDDPWAIWVRDAIERTKGTPPALLPGLGGSICNDVFTDILGLPSIWVPHSYGACSQHAPNEHILMSEFRDAIEIMTGVYWDLGEDGTPS